MIARQAVAQAAPSLVYISSDLLSLAPVPTDFDSQLLCTFVDISTWLCICGADFELDVHFRQSLVNPFLSQPSVDQLRCSVQSFPNPYFRKRLEVTKSPTYNHLREPLEQRSTPYEKVWLTPTFAWKPALLEPKIRADRATDPGALCSVHIR
jgi:hypothetical protein